jgi:hypothetical protein
LAVTASLSKYTTSNHQQCVNLKTNSCGIEISENISGIFHAFKILQMNLKYKSTIFLFVKLFYKQFHIDAEFLMKKKGGGGMIT